MVDGRCPGVGGRRWATWLWCDWLVAWRVGCAGWVLCLPGYLACGVAGGLHGGGVVSSGGWVGAVLGCGVIGGLHGGWILWVSAWSGMGICPPCDPSVAPWIWLVISGVMLLRTRHAIDRNLSDGKTGYVQSCTIVYNRKSVLETL